MSIQIITGECREVLRTLADESVHCVVTSPPYWGLRDYGIEGQLGMERSLGEFVQVMVDVFREVRRVLRKDGTLWLNFGDSYAASVNGRSAADVKSLGNDDRTFRDKPFSTIGPVSRVGVSGNKGNPGADHGFRIMANGYLKPKDLCGIPWRVAFALQEDGWWLRQDIIWSKPNPMPESVTDRPTKAHEYLFLMAKSERYYYDAEAIKEPMKDVSLQRLSQPNVLEQPGGPKDPKAGNRSHKKAINNQAERLIKHEKWKTRFEGWDEYDKSLGRNKRSVWEIATAPFPEAHFATFPPALIEPCILAGTSEKGCCAKCGVPWRRDVERHSMVIDRSERTHELGRTRSSGTMLEPPKAMTIGWSPSCNCDADIIPCTVLDPFGGAGTTGLVADRLGRNSILIELNPEYVKIAEKRLRNDAGMFADIQICAQSQSG